MSLADELLADLDDMGDEAEEGDDVKVGYKLLKIGIDVNCCLLWSGCRYR